MAHHAFTMPITEAQARELRVNDTVTLEGTLFGIRDATQIAMFDKGRTTRFDMHGPCRHPHRAQRAQGAALAAASHRLRAGLRRHHHLRADGALHAAAAWSSRACASSSARAGLGGVSLEAFGELGGAYLAIIGGTAALETTWIEAIEDVDLDDLQSGVAVEIPRARFRARCWWRWTATAAASTTTSTARRVPAARTLWPDWVSNNALARRVTCVELVAKPYARK